MIKLYNYLDSMIEKRNSRDWFFETNSNYFVSEIMELLAIENKDEIDLAFSRANQACDALNISFDYHFKKIYRSDGQNLIVDWKVSSLACYLLIVNCNPTNESVAKAQLYFAVSQISKKQ